MSFEDNPQPYDPLVVESLLMGYQVHDASLADMAAAVQMLTARGVEARDIMTKLHIEERRVHRLRKVTVTPYPDMMATYDYSERRAKHLTQQANAAMSMAVDMRSDPYMPYLALVDMPRQDLIEVAMILACMVNVDATVKSALDWTTSSLAEVIPLRQEA